MYIIHFIYAARGFAACFSRRIFDRLFGGTDGDFPCFDSATESTPYGILSLYPTNLLGELDTA